MTPLGRLLELLAARGLSVRPGAETGHLILHGPKDAATPAVLDAVRAFKPDLLALFGPREEPAGDAGADCPVCGRGWYVPAREVAEAVARDPECCKNPNCPYRRA